MPAIPVWDSEKFSTIKRPIALLEGRDWRFVDEADVMFRADGGREIFAEKLEARNVRTNPVKRMIRRKDGTEIVKLFYTLISMKCARRKNEPPHIFGGGESARLTPGRPTGGDIASGGYGQLLDRFSSGDKKAQRLFRSRRTPRHRGGVSAELQMATAERSLLFFPFAGMTEKIRDKYRRKPVIAPPIKPDADTDSVSD